MLGKKLGLTEGIAATVRAAMKETLTRILTPTRRVDVLADIAAARAERRPYVIVFVGVNGVGKSTSLSKVRPHARRWSPLHLTRRTKSALPSTVGRARTPRTLRIASCAPAPRTAHRLAARPLPRSAGGLLHQEQRVHAAPLRVRHLPRWSRRAAPRPRAVP